MLLYIVRHGDPDYSNDSLTELGKRQAEAVAKRLSVHGIDEIYSSPLGRAQLTAKPTAEMLKKEIKINSAFSENRAWHLFTYVNENKATCWSMGNKKAMLGSDRMYETNDSFSHGFYCDDEATRKGYAELCEEWDKFFEELGYKRAGRGNEYIGIQPNRKKIAVFCHQGMGLHLLSHILNFPIHLFTTTFDISHSGITVIEFPEAETAFPKCLCFSDLSHIYKDGLPLKYNNSLDI